MQNHIRAELFGTRIRSIAVCLAVLFAALALSADTIYLHSGQKIQGTIVSQDAKSIRIKSGGKEQVILKTAVRRITYEDKKTAEQEAEEERIAREKKAQEDAEREKAEAERLDRMEKLRIEGEKLKAEIAARNEKQKQAEEAARERSLRAGWPSVWRSFVLPGWGQYYRGDKPRGIGYMAAAGLSAYYVYALNQQYRAARADYQDAQTLALASMPSASSTSIYSSFLYANIRRNDMHRSALRANFAAALLIAAYAFSGSDALFYRSESSRTLAEDLNSQERAPQVSVAATLRF